MGWGLLVVGESDRVSGKTNFPSKVSVSNCVITIITLTSLYHSFHQVVHVKFQGILLQLAEGVQGFAPHQLAKGRTYES